MIIPPATIREKSFRPTPRLQRPTLAEYLAAITSRQPSIIPLSAKKEPIRLVFKKPEPEAKLMAEVVGDRAVGEVLDATTDHAWLVVLGHFAQALGVVRELLKVPLAQRQGPDKMFPQTKLLEFLVGILGG